jgi:hypothetical protein
MAGCAADYPVFGFYSIFKVQARDIKYLSLTFHWREWFA